MWIDIYTSMFLISHNKYFYFTILTPERNIPGSRPLGHWCGMMDIARCSSQDCRVHTEQWWGWRDGLPSCPSPDLYQTHKLILLYLSYLSYMSLTILKSQHTLNSYLSWRSQRPRSSTSDGFLHHVSQGLLQLQQLEKSHKGWGSSWKSAILLVAIMNAWFRSPAATLALWELVRCHCSLTACSPPAGSRGSASRLRALRRLFLMDSNDSPWQLKITFKYNIKIYYTEVT